MNKYVVALMIVFATFSQSYSQIKASEITGTWRAEAGSSVWIAVLKADGPRLTGAVRGCASAAIEISDGRIDGNRITFTCKSADGDRTTSLIGVVTDDVIDFTWGMQVREGGARPADSNLLFGVSAPHQFTAKRVPNASDYELTEMADQAVWKNPTPGVTFDRILRSSLEPQNWLTYSGTVLGQRYSPLVQITPANVKNLELAWLWQGQSGDPFEATPLVVDGVVYTVEPPNHVVALDAATGRVRWTYLHTPKDFRVCCGRVNRGLAIHGNTLFMGTLDAHLLAIDTKSGKLVWDTVVANSADPTCRGDACYAITHAPLVVKDKVLVGTAGAEGFVRGFVAAFDVTTGKEVWRFFTVPAPGESGGNTWSGDSWKTGGATIWNTGSYDPALNLTYWGTGNAAPDYDPASRLGDNLYSDSVIALNADTGKLQWHYQFTPHDDLDWDAAIVPVLADIQWQGRPRKVLLAATKNGLMYVLDRATGEFLLGKPFVTVNWMTGFDNGGRPIRVERLARQRGPNTGERIRIAPYAATNWYPPSYSPTTGLFYIPAWERATDLLSTGFFRPIPPTPGYSAVRAFDPTTGAQKWEFGKNDTEFSGILTTASGLLFTGVAGDYFSGGEASRRADGYFYALDANTGQLLWQMELAGSVRSGPVSYAVGGKQYVAVAAGNTLFSLAVK